MRGATSVIVLLVVEIVTSHVLNQRISKWQKLTHQPKCIEARSDKYATFRHHRQPGFLAAIKFVHVSGRIRCHYSPVHNSNWGCRRNVQSNLGIFLTDWKDHIIFPNKRQAYFAENGRWYGLAGYDASSAELVMSNFADPIYVNGNQRLRIWYGEDLYDHSEEDNYGKVCMDVYGYLLWL